MPHFQHRYGTPAQVRETGAVWASDDRQWMPYSIWAVIGLLGAALIIGAMPLPDDGRMPSAPRYSAEPEPSGLGPAGEYRISQQENAQ